MKKWLPVAVVLMSWSVFAYGWSINPEGTSGAPVAVSTAVVEVAPCAQRASLQICNTGSQTAGTIGTNWLLCANGPTTITSTGMTCGASGTGGTFAPTAAGAGIPIFPGTCQTLNAPDNTTWNGIQAEWDCICTATNGCEAYAIGAP
jgi:hypothetical protein